MVLAERDSRGLAVSACQTVLSVLHKECFKALIYKKKRWEPSEIGQLVCCPVWRGSRRLTLPFHPCIITLIWNLLLS